MNSLPPIIEAGNRTEKSSSPRISRLGFVLNVGLLPGLGTLLARRWVSGVLQLLMSATGLCVVVVSSMKFYIGLLQNDGLPPWSTERQLAFIATGVALFIVAWLWALVVSLVVLNRQKKNGMRGEK